MNIGIISTYPPPKLKHAMSEATSSYTHNLVNSLTEKGVDVTIFSDKLDGIDTNYVENKIQVNRCWDKGIRYPFQIFYNVFISKVEMVHIQHEFFVYGGGISVMIFPFMQLLLKLLNKPLIMTIHQVIPISKLDKKFIKNNRLKGRPLILKICLYFFIKMIVMLSTRVIVHENKFRDILKKEYNCNIKNVSVIPHGIEERKDAIEKNKAKKILGYSNKKIVLFFGYIAGYKGIETLVNSFKYIKDDDIILLIAGGEPIRLKGNKSQIEYIEMLKRVAKDINKNIVFTGFVLEKDIKTYFSAADIVILPYSANFGGSGSMSFAISYDKPFLVSEEFKGIELDDSMFFKRSPKDLANKINEFLNNEQLVIKSLDHIKELKNKRNWKNVGHNISKLYFSLNGKNGR